MAALTRFSRLSFHASGFIDDEDVMVAVGGIKHLGDRNFFKATTTAEHDRAGGPNGSRRWSDDVGR